MDRSRGFLFITYKLYHHLDKLDGEVKSTCLNVFLSVMKYAWKKNGYEARLRHASIEKDTGLSRATVKRCLETLNKLNIVKSIRGRSGKTYIVNSVFLKSEIAHNYTPDSSLRATLEETIYNNNIDKIIGENKGNLDDIINSLATLPLADLKADTKNVYYCKLAIQRKEELARELRQNYVDPKKIVNALSKVTKESNFRYKTKKQYYIKNNIKPWENK
jgi:predicted transcriptional regulator|tara:strand:+ start:560 stop:1213 length:654 start_codon:yes stop_codon:yes gene_type:complete